MSENKLYQDEGLVRYLYHEKQWTQKKIAEFCDCPISTLSHWFGKFGIKARSPKWYKLRTPPSHVIDQTTGYEKIRTKDGEKRSTVMIHHLVLIAEGEDPHDVFSDEIDTHHKNNIPWDNRPSNLETMEKREHGMLHWKELEKTNV